MPVDVVTGEKVPEKGLVKRVVSDLVPPLHERAILHLFNNGVTWSSRICIVDRMVALEKVAL